MFFNPQFLSLQHFVHTLDDAQEAHGGAELFGRVHGIVQHTLHDVVARLHLDAIEIELEPLRETFGDVAEESKARRRVRTS